MEVDKFLEKFYMKKIIITSLVLLCLIFLCVVAVGFMGSQVLYNKRKGEQKRTAAITATGASPLAQFTPQEMADTLQVNLQFEAERYPAKQGVAQISFRKAIPSHRLVEILAPYHLTVVQFGYSYGAGSGWSLRGPRAGESLQPFFRQFYEKQIVDNKIMREQGELYINAIGVRGTPREMLSLWNSAPEIFAIKFEWADYINGMPLYPETDMSSWF